MTYDEKMEILMMDSCTKFEAKKYLDRNGVTIYEASEIKENFDYYVEEWTVGADEEEKAEFVVEFRKMIDEKIPMMDWGVVECEKGTYYIAYEN